MITKCIIIYNCYRNIIKLTIKIPIIRFGGSMSGDVKYRADGGPDETKFKYDLGKIAGDSKADAAAGLPSIKIEGEPELTYTPVGDTIIVLNTTESPLATLGTPTPKSKTMSIHTPSSGGLRTPSTMSIHTPSSVNFSSSAIKTAAKINWSAGEKIRKALSSIGDFFSHDIPMFFKGLGASLSRKFKQLTTREEPTLKFGGVGYFDKDLKLEAVRHEIAAADLPRRADGSFDLAVNDDRSNLSAQKFHVIKEKVKSNEGKKFPENSVEFRNVLKAALTKYEDPANYAELSTLIKESGRDKRVLGTAQAQIIATRIEQVKTGSFISLTHFIEALDVSRNKALERVKDENVVKIHRKIDELEKRIPLSREQEIKEMVAGSVQERLQRLNERLESSPLAQVGTGQRREYLDIQNAIRELEKEVAVPMTFGRKVAIPESKVKAALFNAALDYEQDVAKTKVTSYELIKKESKYFETDAPVDVVAIRASPDSWFKYLQVYERGLNQIETAPGGKVYKPRAEELRRILIDNMTPEVEAMLLQTYKDVPSVQRAIVEADRKDRDDLRGAMLVSASMTPKATAVPTIAALPTSVGDVALPGLPTLTSDVKAKEAEIKELPTSNLASTHRINVIAIPSPRNVPEVDTKAEVAAPARAAAPKAAALRIEEDDRLKQLRMLRDKNKGVEAEQRWLRVAPHLKLVKSEGTWSVVPAKEISASEKPSALILLGVWQNTDKYPKIVGDGKALVKKVNDGEEIIDDQSLNKLQKAQDFALACFREVTDQLSQEGISDDERIDLTQFRAELVQDLNILKNLKGGVLHQIQALKEVTEGGPYVNKGKKGIFIERSKRDKLPKTDITSKEFNTSLNEMITLDKRSIAVWLSHRSVRGTWEKEKGDVEDIIKDNLAYLKFVQQKLVEINASKDFNVGDFRIFSEAEKTLKGQLLDLYNLISHPEMLVKQGKVLTEAAGNLDEITGRTIDALQRSAQLLEEYEKVKDLYLNNQASLEGYKNAVTNLRTAIKKGLVEKSEFDRQKFSEDNETQKTVSNLRYAFESLSKMEEDLQLDYLEIFGKEDPSNNFRERVDNFVRDISSLTYDDNIEIENNWRKVSRFLNYLSKMPQLDEESNILQKRLLWIERYLFKHEISELRSYLVSEGVELESEKNLTKQAESLMRNYNRERLDIIAEFREEEISYSKKELSRIGETNKKDVKLIQEFASRKEDFEGKLIQLASRTIKKLQSIIESLGERENERARELAKFRDEVIADRRILEAENIDAFIRKKIVKENESP